MKIYYMLQALERHYVMVPVSRIEYDDGGTLVDTSTALISGAYAEGRVHVVYGNGTEVYVNASERPWAVTLRGESLELPQWGWAAAGGTEQDMAVSYSALVAVAGKTGPRRRVDESISHGQSYLDSRGGYVRTGTLAGQGSAALKTEDGVPWVIPADSFTDFGFIPEIAGFGVGKDIAATACHMDKTEIGPARTRWSRGMLHILPEGNGPVKYKLAQTEADAPAKLEAPLVAPAGREVQVRLPAGVHDNGAVSWELAGKAIEAQSRTEGDALLVTVPGDVAPDSLLWLSVPTAGGTLWADFVTAAPFDVAIDTLLPAKLAQDDRLQARIAVSSNLPEAATVSLALAGSEGVSGQPPTSTLELPAYGTQYATASFKLPWQPGTPTIGAEVSQGQSKVTGSLGLSAVWEYPILLDLTDPAVPFTKGYCVRGGKEIIGGKDTEDGSFEPTRGRSGGVERTCLFSHPPYGRNKAGYAFAIHGLELPAELQTSLEFAMGMREGLHATDGVTYKVIVVDAADKQTEVFSQHHKATAWQETRADLSAFAGQRIRLKLIADCGPADDTTADHALWGDAKVVVRDERAKRLVVTAAQ